MHNRKKNKKKDMGTECAAIFYYIQKRLPSLGYSYSYFKF